MEPKNQCIVNEDRFNQLPEALILRVLSFLPTKNAIATSVLSKQWRSRWKMVPNLEFDFDEHFTYSEVINRSFLSHKAPALDSLRLTFRSDLVNPVDIGLWIGIAFARHLRELVLHVLPGNETFIFPSSLCTCNTLETLTLMQTILVDIPYPVLMKSLKTLNLESVSYKDDASIRNLLSGCPNLEDLVVDRAPNYDDEDIETFTIEVMSLKRLSIYDNNHGEGFRRYMINTPSLKHLTIQKLKGFKFCLNAPELVEAKFIKCCYIITEKFLGSLKTVKSLSFNITPSEIIYPIGSIFYNLVYLEIYTHREGWRNLLTVMLDISPKLQVLKLIDPCQNLDKDGVVDRKWNEPKHVPECLLSHLETFVWERYNRGREEEKEVALYILRNARRLKNATFNIKRTSFNVWKDVKKVRERREMLNELGSVAMASDSCQLLFEVELSHTAY